MKRILLVCGGNTDRSPMAKAILEDLLRQEGLSQNVLVDSAGLSPDGKTASFEARRTIEKMLGADLLENHKPRSVHDLNLQVFDLILTMTQSQRERLSSSKTYTLKEFAGLSGNIEDPVCFRGKPNWEKGYRACAGEIKTCLQQCLKRITQGE